MTALLEVSRLCVNRGSRTVLEIPHLAIQEGEVMAVIGPNGADKSTLLLVLGNLLRPDAGEFLFRGRSVKSLGDLNYRRCIGLVLQEPLLLDVSVFENVAAGLRYRGLPKTDIAPRVEVWLERLGIASLRQRRARDLSGGEAQRVSLARAFALQPQVLLLDEPFSSLDSPTRLRLLDDLQSLLAATGVTTVFVTHDLDEALLLGDRVAILLDGSLRQVAAPERVFSAPADSQVAAFVGMETVIPGRVVEAQEGQVIVQADGLRLAAVGDLPAGRKVLFCLRPEDVTLWPVEGVPRSSARNRLSGVIRRLSPQGPLVRVMIKCGRFPVMALVTRASARDLELAEGRPVIISFKATAVHLIPR